MAIDPLTATSVLLKGLEAFGSFTELRGSASANDLNASLAQGQADSVIEQGEFSARRQEEAGTKIIGSQLAAYAKAGVKFEGSPMDVYLESARNIRRDIIMTRLNAANSANSLQFEALQRKIAAGQARTRSIQALGKGLLDVTSTLAIDKYNADTADKINKAGDE